METVMQKHGRINDNNYEIRKRNPKPARNSSRNNNVFYITKKTNIQSQKKKIIKILESSSDEVVIHGLGSSLNRALVMAIEVKKYFMGSMNFYITTSTVKVTDDLFPMSDEHEMEERSRPLSAVQITFISNRAS